MKRPVHVPRELFRAICIVEGIDIVIQILGIVAVSRDHYCGSVALTVYQGVTLFFLLYSAITAFSAQMIIALLLKIGIFVLCILFIRQLGSHHTNNHHIHNKC